VSGDRFRQLVIVVTVFVTVLSVVRFARSSRPRPRRAARLPALSLASFGLVMWACFVEPAWIETTTTPVPWKGPPLRVVLLADLHAGRTSQSQIRETVERTNDEHPDVVVLAGDFISGFDATPDKLAMLEELRALRPRVGSFAVLGNHDTETFGTKVPRAATITARLEAVGVVVLRNTWKPLVPGVAIVGLGDHDADDTDARKAFATAPDGVTLVVAHNPISLNAKGVRPFDVALAGHTHGGQVCVPFLRWCPFAHEETLPYTAGLFAWPTGGALYVTRGIGESGLRARFACRPEITVLELGPSGEGGNR